MPRPAHVLLFEPPARTSNKFEGWVAMPDAHVTVVSDRDGWGTDDVVVCKAARVPILGRAEGWAAAPAWLRRLDRLDALPVDVVISHELYSFSTYQASKLARRREALHVVHISETMASNPVYRIPPYGHLTRRAVRLVDGFVCTTELARQHAIELGCAPERAEVVHSGVDIQTFSPRPEGLPDEPIVLFVGMLRANRGADKGVLDLVEAVARVHASEPAARLLLVGEGHLRPQLEAMATTRPFLSVLPRVPRSEVGALMRTARVIALPSKRTWKWEEQFGFVLAEGMATGLPVVATRSGAIPEVVAPWNPLVDEGDVAALAAGISEALGPSGDEWGRRNRQWVEGNFNLEVQARRLREVVGAALERRPAQRP